MHKIIIFLVILNFLGLVPAREAGARARYGKSRVKAIQANYDQKSEEKLKGEVIAVSQGRIQRTRVYRLMLKTEEGIVSVFLGPPWYVNQQETIIDVGDTVEVKGSRGMSDSQAYLMASWVKKGDQVLELRDDEGVPRWAKKHRTRRRGQH